MTSSMSILPATTSPAVALEIGSPTPIATHISVTPSERWSKIHRKSLIIAGVVAATLLLATAGLLYYFLSYKPDHQGSSSVYNQKEFLLWANNHGIVYSSADQQNKAFSTWLNNLQAVHRANLNSTDVKYSMGPYADLTQEEYQNRILTLNLGARSSTTKPPTAAGTTTPASSGPSASSLNWADNKGMVSPVKNQGQCGDCWAFATAEAFEVAYNMAYNPSTSIVLSPQQITSCDNDGDQGCNGGDPVNVYQNYLSPSSGNKLTTEANYPFTSGNSGQTGTCNAAQAATGTVELKDWSYAVTPTYNTWSQQLEDQLIAALQTRPVTICIDASPWQNYAGGVLSNGGNGGCTANQQDIDHAVQLVGYTATYWIVKNQWGTGWGEQGYIYLARGANTCCIFCEATQVTVTSTQPPPATAAPTTQKPTSTATTAAPATTAAAGTTKAGQTTASGASTASTTRATTAAAATTTTKKATATTTPLDPYWWFYYFENIGK